AIPELLSTRSTAGSGTMFRGIEKLLPGHLLVFEKGATTIRQYWDVPERRSSRRADQSGAGARGDRDAVAEFRDRFEESIRLRLVWHEDEPIAHPSSVPLYFVSALARRHVTVVLTGEGSDELLAGYGKYLRTAYNWRAGAVYERVLPRSVRRAVSGMVPSLPG